MGRARVFDNRTPTNVLQRQRLPLLCFFLSLREMMMMMGECVRSGSNSPQTTGNRFPAPWRTSIQCLDDDDDDDIAFSLWRVLLRKCINTLWYGWFTFFCFLLLLAIFTFFYFFSYYIYRDIRGRRNGAVWSLPFLHGLSYVHLQRVCECFCSAQLGNLFWSKDALIVTRVFRV